MTKSNTVNAIAVYFILCIVLGGASNAGFLANLLLQVSGLAILTAVTFFTDESAENLDSPRFKYVCWIVAGAVLVQFIPLPSSVWQSLPGRAGLAEELSQIGVAASPTFVTLSIHESLASAVWAIPAVCLLACLLKVGEGWEKLLLASLVAAAFVALSIGLVQFFGGRDSPAYFYDFTNRGYLVGTFANANHMASLLLVTLPFLAALIRHEIDRKKTASKEYLLLAVLLLGFFVIGLALVGSLTGYALAVPVIVACCSILFVDHRRLFAILLIPAAALGTALFALTSEGENVFDGQAASSSVGRQTIFEATWRAIADFFPSGTGLGTFQEVYTRYESIDAIDRSYVNHAHNDYLEIVLEFGIVGLLVIAAFACWWIIRARAIWRNSASGPYAQAAVIASAVILAHSAWDYPLRTAALSCVFALSCVLMAQAKAHSRVFHHKKAPIR